MASLHRSVEAVKEDAHNKAEGLSHKVEELQTRLREKERELEESDQKNRALEVELEQRDGEMKELMAEKARLTETMELLATKTADLADTQTKLHQALEVGLGQRDGEMKELMVEKMRLKTEHTETLEFLATKMAGLADAQTKLRRALEVKMDQRDRETRDFVAQKTRLETEHTETMELLATKTTDLTDALAKLQLQPEDILTDQAVLALVHAFNTEIKDTAAFLADAFEFEEKTSADAPEDSEEMAEIYERATEILGHALVDLLRAADHHTDPGLVRLAFQGGIIEYARWMSGSWFFEDPEDEQLLADIYQRVRTAQPQAVAGRWRALTHRHVQELIHGAPELSDYFVDAFVNVLLSAGFKSSSAALHELIGQRFADRIGAVVRLALGLNKAVGSEVTLCELKTLSAAPGVAFDKETMVDVVDGAAQPGEPVLCTYELGLSRGDKVDGTWTKTILLKPTVVLQSGLEELLSQGGNTPTKTKRE
ncbi:hypothetical protein DFH07DRAFT_752244 [Mycena maculata]|uniref:Uncharacterized protein n=1 Tax=Mycena maculata TaxID=230809 RepID=A0AAD7IBF2_9AGAR|nr:hypothetical protein DFH07DRAFT_752244 [Mycena maculata]